MKKSKNTYYIEIKLFIEKIRPEIISYFPDDKNDYSHSIEHTDRVVKIAQYLCEKEKGNYLVVSLGALFHDIARSMEEKGEC